eukprot:9746837-Alexandrium_andersonii.AAC.1
MLHPAHPRSTPMRGLKRSSGALHGSGTACRAAYWTSSPAMSGGAPEHPPGLKHGAPRPKRSRSAGAS